GLISAYAHGFSFRSSIFRFVSILGPRYSHGHVFDFVRKLLRDPHRVEVLGDGRQRKSYLHVDDCVDGILRALGRDSDPDRGPVSIYNLGHADVCTVDDSLGWICRRLGVAPERSYTGGVRGWVGDSPLVHLDCARIRDLGFEPRHSIADSVDATAGYLLENRWLLDARA
ncbi:MAG: NAD-dependent epimerase/dehydratase family protein, partial [Acidobacteriota bacterium]